MWCRLFLVFLVSAASAEHFQAWKTDTEYEYNVRGRTLAAIHDVADQYTGIVLRARLTVRPKSEDTLEAKVSNARYAQIHTKLPDGWKSEIPDSMLDLKQFPISEKVFEIKMKHGVIRDIIVDKDVPTWEVNVLKSIVGQFQVDTQGENLMGSSLNHEPEENYLNAMYKTMEDSVGGKCEVVYDINNLPELVVHNQPELVPMPELRGEGDFIDIVKTKNYSNCEQRMSYQFGIVGWNRFEPGSNDNTKMMSRSSVSRIVLTGDLKTFTVQSSVTTNKVIMSPQIHNDQKGMVSSRVNVTLLRMGPVSSGPWSTPANPESTGNLVYSFNSPFAGVGENRRAPSLDLRDSEERLSRYASKKPEGQQDDYYSEFDSSNSVNSLESNEDHSYYQPKPTLNEAPQTPLLPFFVGYRGRSIEKSNEIDVIATSKSLASQIGSDLYNPNSIPDEQTLEKFTILTRLIRTMSTQQIAEVQREVYQSYNEIDPHDESQSLRRNTWVAFRDAVVQAGTGPALITIKSWIKEKKIMGVEAATVVGALSKTARTPTPEYMAAYFELVTMPETTSNKVLHATALIGFAELIRFSQVSQDDAHNLYPVHSFGRLSPKNNPAVFRDYIPYMAEQLKQSLEKNDASKAHAFIRALGNVAHPTILSIFEPYLEGKLPATTFQRTLMVFSINKLASLRPTLARGVFYKIYQNTAEAHPVRCAAVLFLMSTNPPESMLQRMAEFTNYDHSKHVNAAVKSSIESASKLTTLEGQDFARKARNVLSLLNKESYGYEYTNNYYTDNAADEPHNAYQSHTAYIGSDDSLFPQAFYASMRALYGDMRSHNPELGAMLSSVKDLCNEFYNKWNHLDKEQRQSKEHIPFSSENIAKLLKIEGEEKEQLEGVFWMNTQSHKTFMSFDKRNLQNVPELLNKAATYLKDGHNFNMVYLENYEITVSFPMESGFPFLYVMKIPSFHRMAGFVKGENSPNSVKASLDLRLMFSTQIQGRLGFITPFEHQYYMGGLNKNFHAYAPIHADFNYDKSEKQFSLKLEPIEKTQKHKLLHYSIVPFTSRHNILNTTPVSKDKETHEIKNPESSERSIEWGESARGIQIAMTSTAPVFPNKNYWGWDLLGHLTFPFGDPKIKPLKTEITIMPNPSSDESVVLTGSFENYHDDTTKYDKSRSLSSPKGKAPIVSSKKIKDPERRQKLIKQAAEGIAAADAYAIDMGVELPGQEPLQWFMTMAVANSKVDEKSRALVYWRFSDPNIHGELESCIGLEGKGPSASNSPINKKTLKSRSFDVDLRIGKTCENGFKAQINGKQEQTDEYRQILNKLPVMLQCMREMKKGVKFNSACEAANVNAWTMDKSDLTITFDPANPRASTEFVDQLYSLTDDLPNARMTFKKADSADNNIVKISMKLVEPENKGKFELQSANVRLVAEDVDVGPLAILATNAHPELLMSDRVGMRWSAGSSHQHMCVVDNDWATTFDKTTYPVHLGKCWHVAMTTYPKYNKDNKAAEPIDKDAELSVVVRDSESNKKDVKFVLGKHQLKLTWEDSKVRIEHDGKVLDLSEKRSYRYKGDGQGFDFEVFQWEDGSVRLFSLKYDFDAIYDGERIKIKTSDKYRNEVRGLCGNYDGEPANDFMSPRNCLLTKPEDFVASYAITSSECQGPALKNAKKASEAHCIRETVRPGNVISDREAGRPKSGKSNWGFHTKKKTADDKSEGSPRGKHCITRRTKFFEEDNELCFSLKPMPTCASACKPLLTKVKAMSFYCMPKGPAAQLTMDRVKQGANPDFSQKTASKNKSFEMPVHCHAA